MIKKYFKSLWNLFEALFSLPVTFLAYITVVPILLIASHFFLKANTKDETIRSMQNQVKDAVEDILAFSEI